MKALRIDRSLPRFGAATVAGRLTPGGGAKIGPLSLRDIDPPELPGPGWVEIRPRLAGICGSDLSTIDGKASRYFEPIVSFPFVPGHEVVADRGPADQHGADGTDRVVLEPVLGCAARGITPPCPACARGDLGGCERIAHGDLEPGLQSGFCCETGGGWSTRMVAHDSQLHPVPDDWSDEAAVMVEPTACAIHGALAAHVDAADTVAVIGAGTLGLLTVAALDRWTPPATLVVAAKHPHQRRLARDLGATAVCAPGELGRVVRRVTGSLVYGDTGRLTGGADVVLDCVGSEASLTQALAVVRPKGRVVVIGMPGQVSLDLTGLWHREVALVGAYAYGTEHLPDGTDRRTFDLAFELVGARDLGRLVSATYPLARYRDAITHAAQAGDRGAVKVAFDLRSERERAR